MEPELIEEDERQNAAGQSAGAANSLNSLFGMKTPQMELDETTKMQRVAMQTLEMVRGNAQEVIKRKNPREMQRMKKRIQEKLGNLKELNKQMVNIMILSGISCEDVAAFNYTSDENLDEYEDMVLQFEELLTEIDSGKAREKLVGPKSDQAPAPALAVERAKVPKLELTTYGGDPLKWQEFWEQYRTIIHTSNLATTMKFHYLRKVLVGRAAAVIKGLPTTEDNYVVAVDKLRKEFGDNSKLRSAHVKAIREVQSINNAQNLTRLRRFYEEISINYASLESMGYEEQVGCLVEETVMKLPRIIRYEITKEDRTWTQWRFPQFLDKLWHYLKACEEIENAEPQKPAYEHPKRSIVHATTNRTAECVYCNETDHKSFECTKVFGVTERKALLQRQKRCFNCTRTNHSARECKSKNLCFHCKRKHHSSICPGILNEGPSTTTTEAVGHISNGPAAYQTVVAKIGGHSCRVLLDSGSGKSYISREQGRKVNSKPIRKEKRTIGTVNGDKEVCCPVYKLEVCGEGEATGQFTTEFAELDLFMLSSVPNIHPEIQRKKYAHLKGIWFSDVSRENDLPIHAILGVKDFAHIKTGRMVKGNKNEPIAEETSLGWTLMGSIQESKSEVQGKRTIMNLAIEQPTTIREEFKKLYDLDVLGIRDGNEDVYDEFKDNITRKPDGSYSVKLPWKRGQYFLPENRRLCEARLSSQLKKLRKSPEILEEYDNVIKQQIQDGTVEAVPEQPDGRRVHHLPHHPVIRKDAETTKLRVVFDASSKEYKYSKSLNDCLHVGPPLQPMMYDILIRFRMYPVALLGDIEKAFLQIGVSPEDRDVMRFIWVKNVKQEPPELQTLRFTKVIFGSGASPFLLGATIREHLENYKTEDPEFVSTVLSSLFVDDLVAGGRDSTEAKELMTKLIIRFKEGHFNMRKWKTNDADLREKIKSESKDAVENQVAVKGQEGEASATKVLGVKWNQVRDEMSIDFAKISTMQHEPTQRGILRTIAAIYDPLGVASPVSIIAKVIYHDVCMQGNGWDEEISEELLKRWQKWLKMIKGYPQITFSRCIMAYPKEEILQIEMHGFADSSVKACCAVIYLVITQQSGVYAKQLTAKSRVAKPKMTVPRLELIGAQLLTKMMENVKSALTQEIAATYGWLDSQTVLCWLQNKSEYKQFVRTRIDQILGASITWKYCPTQDNPADLGTRGTTPEKLQENPNWWRGPEWLTKQKEWPDQPTHFKSLAEDEEKQQRTVITMTTEIESIGIIININRFNSAIKLFRVTAWVLRFINNTRRKSRKSSEILEAEEIEVAENAWMKECQRLYPPSEVQKTQLGLRKDKNQILRCHGRFNLHEDEQPIYLPKPHQLAKILISDAHKRVLHMGVASTLAELRSRFWLPKGRQAVKTLIKSCERCKRSYAKSFNKPKTANLPECRTRPGYAFQTTGVDFAGPFYVRDGRKLKKAYLTLFTCATTRAVHLELVRDMTAKTFRSSLKSLAARRGTPTTMISDNAKTFKATAKWLEKIHKDASIGKILNEQKITWKFNLARASWWGGLFERMVGLVKSTLKKSLGQAHMTFSELQETMLDIEFSLNNRPLTYQGEEIDIETLTPNHLMHGRRFKPIKEDDVFSDEEKIPARKRLKYLQVCKDRHWKRWKKEYLSSLREYHKITGSKPNNIAIGGIVLIQDENQPRNMWKLGRVTQFIQGRDEVIRGATLKTVTNGNAYEIDRPLQKLYPLELRAKPQGDEGDRRAAATEEMAGKSTRVKRRAAINASNEIKTTLFLEKENQNDV